MNNFIKELGDEFEVSHEFPGGDVYYVCKKHRKIFFEWVDYIQGGHFDIIFRGINIGSKNYYSDFKNWYNKILKLYNEIEPIIEKDNYMDD